jgi:hypothetical protein
MTVALRLLLPLLVAERLTFLGAFSRLGDEDIRPSPFLDLPQSRVGCVFARRLKRNEAVDETLHHCQLARCVTVELPVRRVDEENREIWPARKGRPAGVLSDKLQEFLPSVVRFGAFRQFHCGPRECQNENHVMPKIGVCENVAEQVEKFRTRIVELWSID